MVDIYDLLKNSYVFFINNNLQFINQISSDIKVDFYYSNQENLINYPLILIISLILIFFIWFVRLFTLESRFNDTVFKQYKFTKNISYPLIFSSYNFNYMNLLCFIIFIILFLYGNIIWNFGFLTSFLFFGTKFWLDFFAIIFINVLIFVYIIIRNLINIPLTKSEILSIFSIVIGIFFLFNSHNLLLLYVSLELINVSTYLLISTHINFKIIEGSIKYIIFSILASLIFLLGNVLIYINTGTFDLTLIYNFYLLNYFNNSIFYNLGPFFIYLSIFIKIGLAPFHGWLIDVYSGVRFYILRFLSVILKTLFFLLFLKFSYEVFGFTDFFKFFLLSLGIRTLFVGALGGLLQDKFKKIIAFSGRSLRGINRIILSSFIKRNVIFPFFYLFVYNFLSFFFFILIFYSSSNKTIFSNINLLQSRFLFNPLLSIRFLTIIFSLIGIPPFVIFLSKFIFVNLLINNLRFLFFFFILLRGSISAFYYFRILRPTMFLKTFGKITPFQFFKLSFGKFNSFQFVKFYSNLRVLLATLFVLFSIFCLFIFFVLLPSLFL